MEIDVTQTAALETPTPASSLGGYYFVRACVASIWVAAAFATGATHPAIGAVLLIAYPAWDALANLYDARASGGLRANPSQTANMAISLLAAAAMAVAATSGAPAMIAVFGLWAILAGAFQLITGLGRWKTHGAQWVMILSGAQSVLAGAFFVFLSRGSTPLSVASVAGYAAFGAFYFLVSALWLRLRTARRPA